MAKIRYKLWAVEIFNSSHEKFRLKLMCHCQVFYTTIIETIVGM